MDKQEAKDGQAIRSIFLTLAFVLFTGCKNSPREIQNSIELIIEKEGCNVYRFYDYGDVRYFAACPNSSVSWDERSGRLLRRKSISTSAVVK